jgi:hypothetical protein
MALMLTHGIEAATVVVYHQGFETDTAGITEYPGPVNRVASGGGTLGIASASGGFHAEVALSGAYGEGFFTANGGYSSKWPGYIMQSIRIYIDPAAGQVGDGYFWDAAVNNETGAWGRGGGFGVQKTAAATWSLGAEDDFGGFDYVGHTAWATHTNTTPLQITTAGWYQLATEWVESTTLVDRVDQVNTVYDAGGTVLWTDTLPGCMSLLPGQDDSVGGIRYSWLGSQGPRWTGEISPRTGEPIVSNTMTVLAVDDVHAEVIPEPVTMAGLVLGIGSLAGYLRRRRMA